MDPSSCRLAYLDDRFPTDKWLSKGSTSYSQDILQSQRMNLPADLQANLDAILQIFSQGKGLDRISDPGCRGLTGSAVYICRSGRAFSTKLAEMQEASREDCTPILALFDIAPDVRHDYPSTVRNRRQESVSEEDAEGLHPLHRAYTFTSESDESYGLQLLSRLASDLQVQEDGQIIIPIAITRARPDQASPDDSSSKKSSRPSIASSTSASVRGTDPVESQLMLKCLDAGAVDVVFNRLDHSRVLSFSSHAYRSYKAAKRTQLNFLTNKKTRRQSWVGIEEGKPYEYLREAM